ncbi:SRPBCC family protein [Leifsonia flava]|nr:SRPBCC domain-containing protein [Leifsonia flava]
MDLTVTRVLPAKAAEAWRSWTDDAVVRRWWGPTGFTCTLADLDVTVGGTSLVCMSAPDLGFPALYSTWRYTVVEEPTRLEFVHNIADASGTTIDPASIGAARIPRDVRHVITFEPLDGEHTRMAVTEFGYSSHEQLALSQQGLEESLDKLVELYR